MLVDRGERKVRHSSQPSTIWRPHTWTRWMKKGAACFSLGTRIWFLSARVTPTAENSHSAKQQLYNDVAENVRNCCPKLCNAGKRFMLNDTMPVNLVHVKLWYLRICGQWRRKVHNMEFYNLYHTSHIIRVIKSRRSNCRKQEILIKSGYKILENNQTDTDVCKLKTF